jgi:sulfite reductase (NADPH) flavoprotein alpha-component
MLARAADLNRSTEAAFCELHPDDADRLGLANGGRAVLDFGDGVTAELPVRVSAGIAPGCVFVPANQPDLAVGALLGPAGARRVALRAAEEVAA